jgi:hypothetical protein
MPERKNGSNILAVVLGFLLIVLAVCIGFGFTPDFKDKDTLIAVNAGSSALFGGVLLWWAASENKAWGIGFETVTMVVGVVTAVVAILTLTHSS